MLLSCLLVVLYLTLIIDCWLCVAELSKVVSIGNGGGLVRWCLDDLCVALSRSGAALGKDFDRLGD